jgi:hypothetical protein
MTLFLTILILVMGATLMVSSYAIWHIAKRLNQTLDAFVMSLDSLSESIKHLDHDRS